MNLDKSNGMQYQFSDRPILHYILAIGITSIMVAFVLSFRTYDCLNSGNTYDCSYDPDSPAMIGSAGSTPNLFLVLRATTLISICLGLISEVCLLITNIPVYALARYVSRLYRIRRNISGVAFWIAAWILAFLTLPILAETRDLFDPGHMSWSVDLAFDLGFGIAGFFCGVAYCALAFLHQDQNVAG
jgi:hypothetical protein